MTYDPPTKADLCRAATAMNPEPDEDLRQSEWPPPDKMRAVRWSDDGTTLIFFLDGGGQEHLKVRDLEPAVDLRRPTEHVDLTVMERVDSVLSERLR